MHAQNLSISNPPLNTANYRVVKTLMLIVCLLFSFRTSAQEVEPINTERPSFSSSPLALDVGYWQLEAGYQFSGNEGSTPSDEHSVPNALLRFGLRNNFELQLNWSGYTSTKSPSGDTSGYNDASLGVKWQLLQSDKKFVAALFVGFSMPLGSAGQSSGSTDPEAALFWSYHGALDWFGTSKISVTDDKYKFESAAGINLSLGEITGAFVEYKGTFPEGAGSAHDLNMGLTWLLNPDLQIDLHGTAGLNSRATDYVIGTGIALRF
jgi:hypothetical protein